MDDVDVLKKVVNLAYESVENLTDKEFKLEGFKIVLESLLPNKHSKVSLDTHGKVDTGNNDQDIEVDAPSDWVGLISGKLNLKPDQVTKIYHLEDDGKLRLLLKNIPKSQSAATKDIASLLAAGRQAAKFDTGSTDLEFIKEECDYYGRLNRSNFASHIKAMKPNFKADTSNRAGASLTVTAPGYEEAAEIAKKYLNVES